MISDASTNNDRRIFDQIKLVFPYVDDDFVYKCREEFDETAEQIINRILDKNLNPRLLMELKKLEKENINEKNIKSKEFYQNKKEYTCFYYYYFIIL